MQIHTTLSILANNIQAYDETFGSALYHVYNYTNIMSNTAH